MNINVTISLNEETKAALNALTAAIAGANVVPVAAIETQSAKTESPAKTTAKAAETETAVKEKAADPVTIYWFSSASQEVGVVESEEEFKALKKADPKTVKYTEAKYNAFLAKQAEEAEEVEEVEEVEADKGDTDATPTEQDVIDVFSAFLPVDLSDQLRKERRPFVKAILVRFGAKRASELAEEHRALAINFVERKMSGEDLDPADAEFEDMDGLV